MLGVVAVLLALNLAAQLARREAPGPVLLPQAQAGNVLRIEGPQFVTTNEDGSVLTIWELGRHVGGSYESVKVQSFDATGARVK
jgi:hypothetical protein